MSNSSSSSKARSYDPGLIAVDDGEVFIEVGEGIGVSPLRCATVAVDAVVIVAGPGNAGSCGIGNGQYCCAGKMSSVHRREGSSGCVAGDWEA